MIPKTVYADKRFQKGFLFPDTSSAKGIIRILKETFIMLPLESANKNSFQVWLEIDLGGGGDLEH